jgi:hypothetical protein
MRGRIRLSRYNVLADFNFGLNYSLKRLSHTLFRENVPLNNHQQINLRVTEVLYACLRTIEDFIIHILITKKS